METDEKRMKYMRQRLETDDRTSLIAVIEDLKMTYEGHRKKMFISAKLKSNSVEFVPAGINLIISKSPSNITTLGNNNVKVTVEFFAPAERILSLSITVTNNIAQWKDRLRKLLFLHFMPYFHENYHFVRFIKKFQKIEDAFQWNLLSTCSPFEKISQTSIDSQKLVISSRKKLSLEVLKELEKNLKGLDVIISHSADVQKKEELGIGIIEQFHVEDLKIFLTISSQKMLDIWADTDIWLYPKSFCPEKISSHELLPTSIEGCSTTDLNQNEIIIDEESDQSELSKKLEEIGAWNYVDGEFQRRRQKIDGIWRNCYNSRMKFKPRDYGICTISRVLRMGEDLRLSMDRDTPGPIFVNVVVVGEDSIEVEVIRFENQTAEIPISTEIPYYFHEDDTEEYDIQSLETESYILEGYSYEENLEELCEKIGCLSLLEATVKTWTTDSKTHVGVRLAFEPSNWKLKDFRKLDGTYVQLYLDNVEENSVLAKISRIMSEVILITIKGVKRDGLMNEFEISERKKYRIRICPEFMNGLEDFSDGTDLKYYRKFERNQGKISGVAFFAKGTSYDNVQEDSLVILAKCWEVFGVLQKKTDFIIASKYPFDEKSYSQQKVVGFEVKKSRKVNGRDEGFNFSKAYFFMEYDDTKILENSEDWKPIDVRGWQSEGSQTAANGCLINDSKNFWIIGNDFESKKLEELEFSNKSPIKNGIFRPLRRKEEDSESEAGLNADTLNSTLELIESPKVLKMEEKCVVQPSSSLTFLDGYSEIGFMNMTGFESSEGKLFLIINVDSIISEPNGKEKLSPISIGERLFFALDHNNKNIHIVGDIVAIEKHDLKLLVNAESSGMVFIYYWIAYMQMFKMPCMMMLCFQKENSTTL